MKKLIEIDEENILRSNLRISSGIFFIIILIFSTIYIPKYFREYKNLQKNTETRYVELFKNKIKNDVDDLINNIDYRTKINQENVEANVIDEINLSYKATSENYIFIYKILKMEGGKEFAEMVVNPNRLDLVGSLIDDDYQDVKGNMFRKEFMDGIRERGEVFVK